MSSFSDLHRASSGGFQIDRRAQPVPRRRQDDRCGEVGGARVVLRVQSTSHRPMVAHRVRRHGSSTPLVRSGREWRAVFRRCGCADAVALSAARRSRPHRRAERSRGHSQTTRRFRGSFSRLDFNFVQLGPRRTCIRTGRSASTSSAPTSRPRSSSRRWRLRAKAKGGCRGTRYRTRTKPGTRDRIVMNVFWRREGGSDARTNL